MDYKAKANLDVWLGWIGAMLNLDRDKSNEARILELERPIPDIQQEKCLTAYRNFRCCF